MKKFLCVLLTIGFAMGFMYGCDDSDYSPAPVTTTTIPVGTVGFFGKVAMGPVQGAQVFLDFMNGGERHKFDADFDYPKTGLVSTNADGSYTIDGIPATIDITKFKLISTGGKDTSTGKDVSVLINGLPMTLTAGQKIKINITPLTTLVESLPEGADKEALIAAIEAAAGGVNINDIDVTNSTPAITKINQAIVTMIQTLTADIGDADDDTDDLIAKTDFSAVLAAITELAKEIVKIVNTTDNPTDAAVAISDATNLSNAVNVSVTTVVTKINPTIAVAVANAISTTVNTISSVIDETPVGDDGKITETTIINNAVVVSSTAKAVAIVDNSVNETPIPVTPAITVDAEVVATNATYGLVNGGTQTLTTAAVNDGQDTVEWIELAFSGSDLASDTKTGKSVSITVKDKNSMRMIKMRITGLEMVLTAPGTVGISLTADSTIMVSGTASDGSAVSATITDALNKTYVTATGNALTIAWDQLKAAVNTEQGTNLTYLNMFGTKGSYTVTISSSTCAELEVFGGIVNVTN